MHVLSLPPAFVLSQDQTLMLRIQSLAKSRSLNRRELHTCFPNERPESQTPKTSVTSLDKRDRQSLFQGTALSDRPRNSAAHVSLSSIFNCQKTDETQSPVPSKAPKQVAKTETWPRFKQPIQSGNLRASASVASSAAALVGEAGYKATPANKSTPISQKFHFFSND